MAKTQMSETNSDAHQTQEPPKGVISFIYHALYDPGTNQACKHSLIGVMLKFGLTPEDPVFKVFINMQNAGSAQSMDPNILDECLQYTQKTHAADPNLQAMVNALVISKSLCTDIGEHYATVW